MTDSSQEYGAFPALQNGELKALQLYVHADPSDREKIIESYTFTFEYDTRTGDQSSLTGLALQHADGSRLQAGASNTALRDLFSGIIHMCEQLPLLPG